MKFRLQEGESLYNHYSCQLRNAKSISDLFNFKNESGHVYFTSHRVVFTTTQGILCIIGNITDLLFPALQDIKIEIMITDIVDLKIEKVMMANTLCIVCKDGNEYHFCVSGNVSTMMTYVQDACAKMGNPISIE